MSKQWQQQRRFPRVNILGIGVHATDLQTSVDALQAAIDEGDRGYVCLTGVHGIMEAQNDPSLKQIINHSLLVAPDGMPTVWLGKLMGQHQISRVFGPDLMLRFCKDSVPKKRRHFLYGGDIGVAEQLKTNLLSWFPGIQIVGIFTPPFRPLNTQEENDLIRQVEEAHPDIIWVGLSTPKQEHFMAKYIGVLDTKLMVGVGAAFDLHTGRMKDSPQWIKQAGLQWLHRLLQEPRRLWKRYVFNNPTFIVKVLLQLTGIRRYEMDTKLNPISSSGAA